MKVPSWESRL